jgi:hypothetical protein
MKFGQLLATRRIRDWRCISYDALKALIKDGRDIDFFKELGIEITHVDTFFQRQQRIFEKSCPDLEGSVSAADLRSHAVLNYLAVLKILKKHNKKLQQRHLVDHDCIAKLCTLTKELLFKAAFCIAISDSALFTCGVELMGDDFKRKESCSCPECACPVCLEPILDPVALPCNHQFCWSCIASCAAQGITSCPLCRKQQSLEPANIEIERILGGPAERYYPENQEHSLKPRPTSPCSDEASVERLESITSGSPVSTPPSKCRCIENELAATPTKDKFASASDTTPPPLRRAPTCPLLKALHSRSIALVKTALQEPFAAQYPFFESKFGPSLCCALRFGCSEEIIGLLLQHGADMHAKDANGRSALDLLSSASPKLMEDPSTLSDRLEDTMATFRQAQYRYRFGVAKLLLKFGADPKQIGFDMDAMTVDAVSVHF